MVNVRPQPDNQSVLVSLDSLHELVSVRGVPQHFQTLEPVVSGEDMRLCDEVLVRVRFQRGLHPFEHRCCHVMILIVLVERIHAVKVDEHCIIAKFVRIIATIHECRFDCVISKDGRVGRNFFEV